MSGILPTLRAQFGKNLVSYAQLPKVNKVILQAVTFMNDQLMAKNVPITVEHKTVLEDSLQNGDKLCVLLKKENPHALKAEGGKGLAFAAGLAAHKAIAAKNGCCEEK